MDEAMNRADAAESLRRSFRMGRDAQDVAEIDIPTRRQRMLQLAAANPPADDIAQKSISVGGLQATRVAAPGVRDTSVIIHFHGGAYVAGSSKTYAGLLGELSRYSRRTVISVDYRLAPEHPFPAAIEDAISAYKAVLDLTNDVVVVGDSAGGGLAVATMFELKRLNMRLPRRLALFSPWTDLTGEANAIRTKAADDPLVDPKLILQLGDLYRNGEDPRNPLISPVFGDFKGFPPLLIQVGSDEILLDDALGIDRAARSVGVPVTLEVWPEMFHVWHVFLTALPHAREAVLRAGKWLEAP